MPPTVAGGAKSQINKPPRYLHKILCLFIRSFFSDGSAVLLALQYDELPLGG